MLDDPQHLLQSDGIQVLIIRIDQDGAINNQILATMINEALELAALSREERQDRFLQFDAEMDARSSATGGENKLP